MDDILTGAEKDILFLKSALNAARALLRTDRAT